MAYLSYMCKEARKAEKCGTNIEQTYLNIQIKKTQQLLGGK